MVKKENIQEIIYKEDIEMYKYQDSLRWGRFKNASTIEAGLL